MRSTTHDITIAVFVATVPIHYAHKEDHKHQYDLVGHLLTVE